MMQGIPSWIAWLLVILLSFNEARSVIYRLDVTIKNRYGKEVKIVTTDVKHEFIIPPGETYQINSTSMRTLIITAYDNATFRPIKINGEELIPLISKSVAFNVKPVSRVFCVPSACSVDVTTRQGPTDAAVSRTVPAAPILLSTGDPSSAALLPDATDNVITERFTDAAVSPVDPTSAATEYSTSTTTTDSATNAAVSTVDSPDAVPPTGDPISTITTDSATKAATSKEDPTAVSTEALTSAATEDPTGAITEHSASTITTDSATGATASIEDPTSVSTEDPTGAITEYSTNTITTDIATDAAGSIEDPAAVITEAPTNTATEGPTSSFSTAGAATNAAVTTVDLTDTFPSTKDPSSTITTDYATDAAVSTEDPIVTGNPTDTKTRKGAIDSTATGQEDGCKRRRSYIVLIIVLATLLAVLLVIAACLVCQVLRKKGRKKAKMDVHEALIGLKSNEDEGTGQAPNDNETRAPGACPTDLTAVSAQDPSDADVPTHVQVPADAAVPTKGPIDAAVSTQGATDAAAVTTKDPTNAAAVTTKDPTDAVSAVVTTQVSADAAMSTEGPVDAVASAVTTQGPTDAAAVKAQVPAETAV